MTDDRRQTSDGRRLKSEGGRRKWEGKEAHSSQVIGLEAGKLGSKKAGRLAGYKANEY